MPAGHTEKRTLTRVRRELLKDLALGSFGDADTLHVERHQLREMARFGWVSIGRDGPEKYAITDTGRAAMAAPAQAPSE